MVAWGDNDEGEIDVPAGLDHVVAVAAGWYHSLAVTSAGQVIAWGSTADGLTARASRTWRASPRSRPAGCTASR